MHSITDLVELVKMREIEKLFYRIYSVRVCTGNLILPEKIREWAEKRFGNCERQKIVRITNRLSGESTLFNELRAKRPLDAKSEVNLEVEDCAFCDPVNRTPSDVFGRVEGKHCITASNIAKYDCMHAVIVFKEHNPLVSRKDVVGDIFQVAEEWFRKAHSYDDRYRYPFFYVELPLESRSEHNSWTFSGFNFRGTIHETWATFQIEKGVLKLFWL